MGFILLLSVIGGLFLSRSVKIMGEDLFSFIFILNELNQFSYVFKWNWRFVVAVYISGCDDVMHVSSAIVARLVMFK